MILVDANLLLYAHDQESTFHQAARTWWDRQLSGTTAVFLCWPVITAFLRISTNWRIIQKPLSIEQATAHVQAWFEQPNVCLSVPSDNHWQIFRKLLHIGQATANLVNDAHLAALAIGNGCELCSNDSDFARFPKLKWRNPLRT